MIETIFLGLLSEIAKNINYTDAKTFTPSEIGVIASQMGYDFTMRMSPYGNPIVKHRDTEGNNVIFAFYKRRDGIIIRRRLGYDNPFGSGNVLNGAKPFPDVKTAMAYFKKYVAKYPHSVIG